MSNTNTKKILFVVLGKKREIASSRLRAYEFKNFLTETESYSDIQIDLIAKQIIRETNVFAPIKFFFLTLIYWIKLSRIFFIKYDAIYCFQIYFPEWLAKYIAKNFCLLLDITDFGVFDKEYIKTHFTNNNFFEKLIKIKFLRERKSMLATCKYAKLISANAGYTLPEYIKPFENKIRNLFDPVDLKNHKPVIESKKVIIGWTGSGSTARFVNSISGVLCKIKKEYAKKIEIRLHGASPEMFNHEIRKIANIIEWSYEQDTYEVRKIHVGLVPAINDALGKYKQPYKIIRHFAVGAPVIATSVGMVPYMVNEGKTGFFAETKNDWLKYLRMLIENNELRKQMGLYARQTAIENYSYPVYAQKWQDITREAIKLFNKK